MALMKGKKIVQNFYLQSSKLEVVEFPCESGKQITFNNMFFSVMILEIVLVSISINFVSYNN